MQPRERGKKKGSKVVRTGIDEKKVPIKYRFWDGRERGRHNLPQQKKTKNKQFYKLWGTKCQCNNFLLNTAFWVSETEEKSNKAFFQIFAVRDMNPLSIQLS